MGQIRGVAGVKVLRQPALWRRVDQRLDLPGRGIDLLGRLQRIAAIDEYRGLPSAPPPARPIR